MDNSPNRVPEDAKDSDCDLMAYAQSKEELAKDTSWKANFCEGQLSEDFLGGCGHVEGGFEHEQK